MHEHLVCIRWELSEYCSEQRLGIFCLGICRTIPEWNKLESSVAQADSFDNFKSHLAPPAPLAHLPTGYPSACCPIRGSQCHRLTAGFLVDHLSRSKSRSRSQLVAWLEVRPWRLIISCVWTKCPNSSTILLAKAGDVILECVTVYVITKT